MPGIMSEGPATGFAPRVENLLCRVGWWRICGFNSIAETSELSDHLGSASLLGLFGDCRAPFFVTNSLVEDLPDEETLPMRNHPDSLFMSKARYHTTIDNLKDSPFSLDCRVGRLIENAPHVAVALGGSVAVVHARALLLTGTGTNPRGEVLLRRKGCCRGAYFGNDLLCRIDA